MTFLSTSISLTLLNSKKDRTSFQARVFPTYQGRELLVSILGIMQLIRTSNTLIYCKIVF